MDKQLRNYEKAYRAGDDEAGIALLSLLIRSGKISAHKAELAAIYQHPIAMVIFDEPAVPLEKCDEEKLLPLSLEDYSGIAPWTFEVYIRRLLAVTRWAASQIENGLSIKLQEPYPTIRRNAVNYLYKETPPTEEMLQLAEEATLISTTHMYEQQDQHYLWLAIAATARSITESNENGLTSDSGPAWACAAVAHLENQLGIRDPFLGEISQGFGPSVMRGAYGALHKNLVPWLLHPFPCFQ